MTGMSERCETCAHWNQRGRNDYTIVVEPRWGDHDSALEEREAEADAADMAYGECTRIKHGRVSLPDPLPLAITMDGSDYHSALYTRGDFGCVLHEASAEATKRPETAQNPTAGNPVTPSANNDRPSADGGDE